MSKELDSQIDDLVDQWHEQPTNIPLHQYLGMSWDEYKVWVKTSEVPPNYSPPSY